MTPFANGLPKMGTILKRSLKDWNRNYKRIYVRILIFINFSFVDALGLNKGIDVLRSIPLPLALWS
jgi:hypothetical protein